MTRVASTLSFAAIALLGSFLAGCGASAANANGCGTHQYSYVGAGFSAVGGAPWYAGDIGGGWYDPGDDGSDYADESAGSSGSSGSDGSGGAYSSGSGDDGSGDDGTYSGSDDSSGDDGSGDDGSGDDGSGDDGTSSKKHLHTASVALHTQSGVSSSANICYAYSCDLLCAVGSPAIAEREAKGYSSLNSDDACQTAAHGVETWAHDTLGADVTACRLAGSDIPSAATTDTPRTPASPSVVEGFSPTISGARTRSIITIR